MFKSTLGLGLGSTKKSDLNAYLNTLEKKNKEVQRKFSVTDTNAAEVKEESEKVDTDEDSDLLSIQKEFEDEFDSPFIKKKVDRRPSAIDEVCNRYITTLRTQIKSIPLYCQIPAEYDVPFYNSLAAPRSSAGTGVSSALNSFMKYDQKWRGGGAAAKVLQLSTKFRKMFTSFQCPFTINNLKVSVKIESDTESEPVITENSPGSPIKIAEELDKKTFLQHHRRRRKSSGSTSATKAAAAGSPSPRSKSASGARSRLKLSVGSGRASVSPTGTAHAHTPILTATLSEVSPRSPLFDIANVRDISEVLEEDTIRE